VTHSPVSLVLVDRTGDCHGPFASEEEAWSYAGELYPSDEALAHARENADIYVACLVAPVRGA
jgi:hypothetical protein